MKANSTPKTDQPPAVVDTSPTPSAHSAAARCSVFSTTKKSQKSDKKRLTLFQIPDIFLASEAMKPWPTENKMNAEEVKAATKEIESAMQSEIGKAFNSLIARYLKAPCSFKNKDFDKAAFAAVWGCGGHSSVEKKHGLRRVISVCSNAASSLLYAEIDRLKAEKK